MFFEWPIYECLSALQGKRLDQDDGYNYYDSLQAHLKEEIGHYKRTVEQTFHMYSGVCKRLKAKNVSFDSATDIKHNFFNYFQKWWLIITSAAVKLKKERKIVLNGTRTHDLCDTGAVLYKLRYQANWELITLWVRNIPVDGENTSEDIWTMEKHMKTWLIFAVINLHQCTNYATVKLRRRNLKRLWVRRLKQSLQKSKQKQTLAKHSGRQRVWYCGHFLLSTKRVLLVLSWNHIVEIKN